MRILTYIRAAVLIVLLPDVLVSGGSRTASYEPHKSTSNATELGRVSDVPGDRKALLQADNSGLLARRLLPNLAILSGSSSTAEMSSPKPLDSNVAITLEDESEVPDETQLVQPHRAKALIRSETSDPVKPVKHPRVASGENEPPLIGEGLIPVGGEFTDEPIHQDKNVSLHIPNMQESQVLHSVQFPFKEEMTNEEQFQEQSQILLSKMLERQCSLVLRQVPSMCRCSQIEEPTQTGRTKRETSLNFTNDITRKKLSLKSLLSEIKPNQNTVTRRKKDEADMQNTPEKDLSNSDNAFSKQMMTSKTLRRIKRRGVESSTQEKIEEPNVISLRLDCSCNGDQVLELAGISALPSSVHQLHVSDCRGGDVVLAPSLTASDSSLHHLTLTNIKRLTLGGGALDMDLQSGGQDTQFLMEVRNIGQLRISRGAIRLSGQSCSSSFFWKNVILESLPSFAITASNLVNFTLNGIFIEGAVETASLNLESSGTFLILDEVDARAGIFSDWISGDLVGLSITKSRLNLAPGAFQQVSFSQSNPNVIIRNNMFGNQLWLSSKIYPSLASGVFDFTFKDDSALFNISKNYAECGYNHLMWLYEHKKSIVLHWLRCGLLKTLVCHDNDHQPATQPSCRFEEILSTAPAETTTSIIAPTKHNWKNNTPEIATDSEDQESKNISTENARIIDSFQFYQSDLHYNSSIYATGAESPKNFTKLPNYKRDLINTIESFRERQPRDEDPDPYSHLRQTNVHHQERGGNDAGQNNQYRRRTDIESLELDLKREVEPVIGQSSFMALERVSPPARQEEVSSNGSVGIDSNAMGLFMLALVLLHNFLSIIEK